ncbi:hypothetical protein GQ53DRAFT_752634 [Thozetella sp. PMI_491]|nr:hypothetical protein GQ53DRAFT_752634 [Thozetella sp. PMI_491]
MEAGPPTEATLQPDGAPSQPPGLEVPAEFPKKRRGRPPGRPNTTVKEEDYQSNPLVQAWNATKATRPTSVVSINIRQALTPESLMHDTQRHIFEMRSREIIYFVQGWITARHIASKRPSYVNGLLIHSRGQDASTSCAQCADKRAKNAIGPFLVCRVLPGKYHNSCSNCKWFDNTSVCSLYTGPKPNRKRKAKELSNGEGDADGDVGDLSQADLTAANLSTANLSALDDAPDPVPHMDEEDPDANIQPDLDNVVAPVATIQPEPEHYEQPEETLEERLESQLLPEIQHDDAATGP